MWLFFSLVHSVLGQDCPGSCQLFIPSPAPTPCYARIAFLAVLGPRHFKRVWASSMTVFNRLFSSQMTQVPCHYERFQRNSDVPRGPSQGGLTTGHHAVAQCSPIEMSFQPHIYLKTFEKLHLKKLEEAGAVTFNDIFDFIPVCLQTNISTYNQYKNYYQIFYIFLVQSPQGPVCILHYGTPHFGPVTFQMLDHHIQPWLLYWIGQVQRIRQYQIKTTDVRDCISLIVEPSIMPRIQEVFKKFWLFCQSC